MAGNIIGAAYSIYGLGTGSKPGTSILNIKNPDAKYEYGQAGRLGIDTNGNDIREQGAALTICPPDKGIFA
jgi:hypothetical protein